MSASETLIHTLTGVTWCLSESWAMTGVQASASARVRPYLTRIILFAAERSTQLVSSSSTLSSGSNAR